MSVQVSYKKQTLFGIMFLIVILFSLEGIVRFNELTFSECGFVGSEMMLDVDPSTQQQICSDFYSLEFKIDPYLEYLPNQQLLTININSYGTRGSDFEIPKPENVYRIIVIGGSTIFGAGTTSDQTTIPGILQQKFNENNFNKKIEVINGGLSGSFSTTERYRINNTYQNFDPNLLIVYGGWNDAQKKALDGLTNEKRLENYLKNKDSFTAFLSKNLRHIHSLDLVYKKFFTSTYTLTSEEDIKNNSNAWKTTWIEMCTELQNKNIDTIIALQPIVGHPKKLLSDQETGYANDPSIKQLTKIIDAFSTTLPEIDNHCKETIDLRDSFSNISEPIYYDEGHMGTFGNTIIAQKIYEKSVPIIHEALKNPT